MGTPPPYLRGWGWGYRDSAPMVGRKRISFAVPAWGRPCFLFLNDRKPLFALKVGSFQPTDRNSKFHIFFLSMTDTDPKRPSKHVLQPLYVFFIRYGQSGNAHHAERMGGTRASNS